MIKIAIEKLFGKTQDKRPILLVEDNPDDVELTLRAFRRNNIHNDIIVATDGVEALDYLFCRGEFEGRDINQRPVLVLLDLKLPKMGGLDVLKHIRTDEFMKLLPVVILTSSKEESDIISGYELGANSYIQKPVDFAQFTEAVRQLGLYWLLLNESPPL